MVVRHITVMIFAALSAITMWGEQRIVPSEISESPNYRLAANFLSHYKQLLSQSDLETVSDTIRRTKDDGFRYIYGNDATFKCLTGDEDFSISFDNETYRANWSRGGNSVVECVFPAHIGLLTFSNKIDLENDFIQSLSVTNEHTTQVDIPSEDKEALTKVICSDYYLKDKGFYITPRLSHQEVYAVCPTDSTKCTLLIDANRYQLESIANMMLSGYTPKPIDVNVKVSQYGYKSTVVKIPFSVLYGLLSANNSTPYWGVETFDGKMIKGLYVWTNKYGGYNHLLSVSIPITAISEPSTIESTLHCFIRTDNLKSLFEEYR